MSRVEVRSAENRQNRWGRGEPQVCRVTCARSSGCSGARARGGAWVHGHVGLFCTLWVAQVRRPLCPPAERDQILKISHVRFWGVQILLWHRMSVFCRPVTFQSSGCPPLTCKCGQGTSRIFGRVWGKRNMGYFRSSLERASSRKIQLCVGGFSVS